LSDSFITDFVLSNAIQIAQHYRQPVYNTRDS